MFCQHCGVQNPKQHQFCGSCGKQLATGSNSKEKFIPKSFNEFIRQKPTMGKGKGKEKKVTPSTVMIHVSMLREVSNSYRQVNGSRTPVLVPIDGDYDLVKKLAFQKLQRYVPEMEGYDYSDLELCFRSGESALHLPGTVNFELSFKIRPEADLELSLIHI